MIRRSAAMLPPVFATLSLADKGRNTICLLGSLIHVSQHMNNMVCRRLAACFAETLALLASAGCTSQASNPEYSIKFEDPPTGSHIRRDAVWGSTIPINKRYHELTPEQRTIVHRWYQSITPGDEPPFPSDGLKPIHDALRKLQHKLLAAGEIYLIATVEANGEVAQVKAIGSPSPEMTKFASTIVLLTKFKPAVCAGRPCKMDFPLWYVFRVQ